MTLFESDELCTCGNYGCWEAYASERATLKRYAARKSFDPNMSGSSFQDIIDAANNGDHIAREILIQTGHYLGLGMANIIKALDPEAIVIGGRIIGAWEIIYPEIMQTLSKRAFFGKKKTFASFQLH
jgi:predicted NBD/HSP70 family sugar kinase